MPQAESAEIETAGTDVAGTEIEEKREWWEISIDGDKMSWTALREGNDSKTFTATFEMKKVA